MTSNKLLDKCHSALAQIVSRSDCKLSARLARETLEHFPKENDNVNSLQQYRRHDKLITLSEAAALCERRSGKKVHRTTVKSWGLKHRFRLQNVNGWKVDRDEFVLWASRTGRLSKSFFDDSVSAAITVVECIKLAAAMKDQGMVSEKEFVTIKCRLLRVQPEQLEVKKAVA